MANDTATQARITISSPTQGNVRLQRCKSSKVSGGPTTEAQTAMGEDDPVGHTDKPGAWKISLDVLQEKGKPEIDYVTLHFSKEYFTVTREVVGGQRFQFARCRVVSVEPDDDDEGKHTLSVEISALRMKPL
jgi:hypothetical protein